MIFIECKKSFIFTLGFEKVCQVVPVNNIWCWEVVSGKKLTKVRVRW